MTSIGQHCTHSVPPLADADPFIMSKVLYGGYSLSGAQGSCMHNAHAHMYAQLACLAAEAEETGKATCDS